MEEDFDREIKVLVVGNGGVGKTSMIRRFCKGIFTDEYKKTIGVDFLEKAQFVDALQEEVRFMLWDTAGQEEFDAITRTYYRGAGAAVIAFSTTDRASFEAVQMWKGKIEQECGDIAMSLVQNKVDLIDQSVASAEEVEAMARRLGLRLYRTCVKENVNVSEVFMYLADMNNKKAQAGAIQQNVAQSIAPPMSAVQQQGFMQAADAPVSQVGPAPVAAPQEAPKNLASNMPMTVDLGPSKKRTKGKKSISCSIA